MDVVDELTEKHGFTRGGTYRYLDILVVRYI